MSIKKDAVMLTCDTAIFIQTGRFDYGWRQANALKFVDHLGNNVHIARNFDGLRGLPRGIRIYLTIDEPVMRLSEWLEFQSMIKEKDLKIIPYQGKVEDWGETEFLLAIPNEPPKSFSKNEKISEVKNLTTGETTRTKNR